LGRDALDERVAGVNVLDGELPALQLVLALLGVGAGARHRDTDGDELALDAGRPGAERRMVGGKRARGEPAGEREAPGDAQPGADEVAAAVARIRTTVFHN